MNVETVVAPPVKEPVSRAFVVEPDDVDVTTPSDTSSRFRCSRVPSPYRDKLVFCLSAQADQKVTWNVGLPDPRAVIPSRATSDEGSQIPSTHHFGKGPAQVRDWGRVALEDAESSACDPSGFAARRQLPSSRLTPPGHANISQTDTYLNAVRMGWHESMK